MPDIVVTPGQPANGLIISSGTVLSVTSGASALDISVNGGGRIEVLRGGLVTSAVAIVGSGAGGGFIDIFGTASDTTLSGNANGVEFADVFSGGVATATNVGVGALLEVSDGAVASNTTISEEEESSGDFTFIDGGSFEVFSGGTAVGTTIGNGGPEGINLGGNVTLDLKSGAIAEGGITFNGYGVLEIESTVMPTTPISHFTDVDSIDLTNIAYDSAGTAVIDPGTDVLTVTEGGKSYSLDLAGNYENATFSLASDDGSGTLLTTNAPCFAAGTLILTDQGERPVEQLRVGDAVLTQCGEALPVAWIGSRAIDCRRHPQPGKVLPVRIQAHAFAPGRPCRDLLLSPDHAVFAEGVLIPIKHLVNGHTVRQIDVESVTYVHVELPRHAVIFANGLPAESYLDTGDRGSFANGGNPMRLHPAFGAELQDVALLMDALGCAPVRVTGPEVGRVREALAQSTAAEPAFALLATG